MDNAKLNPIFQELAVDYLYHIGIDSSMNLPQLFGDVKYIILTRSFTDADNIAQILFKIQKNIPADTNISITPIAKDERYHLHKIGNTLVVSHGVGYPSILILLNELAKLIHHAKISPKIIRIGLSGGLGLKPNSRIIANEVVNYQLKAEFTNVEYGQKTTYTTIIKNSFNDKFTGFVAQYDVTPVKLLSSRDFYDGQARINGALELNYTREKQQAYLHAIEKAGVKAMDMDSGVIAGFCNYLDIPYSLISKTLINRFETSSPRTPSDVREDAFIQLTTIVANYIIQEEGSI